MTSMSPPNEQYGHYNGVNGYGSDPSSEASKSPLSMSLGFLKTLTEKKSTRGRLHHLHCRGCWLTILS